MRELRDYGAENNIRMSIDKKQSIDFDSERNDFGKSVDEIKFCKKTSPLNNSLLQLRVSSILSIEGVSKGRNSLVDDKGTKLRGSL